MGVDRLSVECDDERPVSLELKAKDPRRGGIDETKSNALAAAHCELIRYAAVDRDRVANAPGHGHFHRIVETAGDRGVLFEAPIAKDPHHVAIDGKRLLLLDNEGAHQPTPDLLGAV